MRCATCQYPLKNLSEHRCPECGRTFDPSDASTFVGDESTHVPFRLADAPLPAMVWAIGLGSGGVVFYLGMKLAGGGHGWCTGAFAGLVSVLLIPATLVLWMTTRAIMVKIVVVGVIVCVDADVLWNALGGGESEYLRKIWNMNDWPIWIVIWFVVWFAWQLAALPLMYDILRHFRPKP